MLVLDAQGSIQHINQQAAAWCGIAADALVGRSLAEAPLPPALGAALQQLQPATPREVWLPTTQQWFSLRAVPDPAGTHWVFWDNITARKQAEAAQQRSSQLLLDIEAVAHTGSYEVDLATGNFYFSDGMYRLFGEAPQSFVPTMEFINARSHPDDAATVRQVLDEAARTKRPYTYRRRIRCAEGEWRTLEAHGEVRLDAAGQAVQLRGLVQDVTERVQAEQALHDSRQLLRRTIDSSLDMVQVFEAVRDEQGAVIDFTWVLNNAAAKQQYGNVIGQRLCQLNPGVVEGIFATFKQVLETGVPVQTERHYVHEQFDGWFHQSVVRLGDGVTTTTRDITERKRAEQELRETKELLQATLDSSRYVVQAYKAVRDASGKIVDFTWILTNQAWLKQYGGLMTGKSLLQENPGVVASGLFELFVQVTESGVPIDHEQYYAHEQFEGWFHQTLIRMGDGFVMNTVDISERKQAQEEIIRLKEELAQKALDRYYSLFTTMEEGVSILEILHDDGDRPVDMRWLEVNPAFEKITGLTGVAGKRTSEFMPTEQYWLDAYDSVVKTGEPLHYENYHAGIRQWYRTHTSRIGGPGSRVVATVFEDITERKHHEQRQEFLLNFSDTLRAEPNADAVANRALALLMEQLQLDRCYIAEYRLAADRADFPHHVGNDRVPPLPSSGIRLSDFPEAMRVTFDRTLVIDNFAETEGLSDQDRQNIGALGLRALVAATLRQGEHIPYWVLVAVSATPRSWTQGEIALVEEVTERTWAAMERARTEEALRLSEEKYRLLFDSIDEGFLLCDVLFDEAGQAHDVFYLEANAAARRLAGRDFTGHRLRELDPDYEAYWYEMLGQVARTGQAVRAEHYAQPHGRWFDFYFFRAGAPGNSYRLAVVFQDITERKQREQNAALLAEIGKDLSLLSTPDDLMQAVGERLGDFLGAAACIFADVDEAQNEATIHHGWNVEGVSSLQQTFRLTDYFGEEFRRAGRAGEVSTVGDTGHDPHANAAAYAALGIGSFITVPFQRQGRWVANITVTNREPREWRADEIALLQEAAARVFPRIERARTEAALAASEAQFRAVANLVPDLLWRSIESDTTWYNQRWYEYTGQTLETAAGSGWTDVIHPDDRAESDRRNRTAIATGEPLHQEHRIRSAAGEYRWFQVQARPLRNAQGEITAWFGAATDIHERKRAELRQRFLLQLSDALRPLTDPVEVQSAAARVLGKYLGAGRAAYAEIEADAHFTVHRDYTDGVPSFAGRYPNDTFGPRLFAVLHAGRTVVVADAEREARMGEAERAAYAAGSVRAAIGVPLIKGGRLAGAFFVHFPVPHEATADEVALVEETAERTWAAMERARAEQALAASEDKYRTLFETIDEGVVLIDLVDDATGRATAYRFVEANQAFEQQTGAVGVIGKLSSEVSATDESAWVARYDEVARTGESQQFEDYHAPTGRWYLGYASRVGGAGSRRLAIVFNNITTRKQHEQEQEFLLMLSDAFRVQPNSEAIGTLATRLVADYLRVDRCYIAHFSRAQELGWIGPEYRAAELPPLSGEYQFADFPEGMRRIETGPLIIRDLWHDASLSDTDKQSMGQALGVRGLLAAALRQGERNYFWCLTAATTHPRDWTEAELAFLEVVAERTWAAMERARSEEALAASEQRLRALITNLPSAAAFVVGPDLRYQLAGGEALDAAGLRPADLLGRTVAEAMPPELVPQHEAHYRQALGGQDFSLEHTAHGRTFISRGVPLPGATGQPEAVLVVSYDITKRKQAEEALLVSETKYRTLFETMDQGFGIGQVLLADEAAGTPLDWQWLEVNPQFERLTGLLRADVLSQTTRQLIPGLEEIWYERYAQAAAGETVNFEVYSPVLDRWFDVYAFALGPSENRRVAVLFSNTSEQKQIEAALREAEARYREQLEEQVLERTQQLQESRDLLQSVLDTSLISMSVLYAERDEAGQVQDFRLGLVNKELERETRRTDLVGKRYAQEYPGVREVGIFDLMLRALATDQPQSMEYFYNYEGFNQWYTCQFVKLGDGLVATNLDITERKNAEQERLKNLRLLEQAEAVAGLGSWDYDLATGTMHWSEGIYHLFDLPVGQPVEPTIYTQLAIAEDRLRAEQMLGWLTSGSGSSEATLRLHVAGQVKTVRLKAVVLYNEASQPVRVLGVDLDISELQRLEADNLRLRLGQQQALFEAVQEAQEEERRRMSESLHNGIGQILYATKLQLDRLPAEAEFSPRYRAAELLSEAIRQTRALSHELTPAILEEFGLEATLRSMCNTLSTPALRWHCHLVLDEGPALPPALQLAAYRLAQELAQNVLKHAHATDTTLEVEVLPAWVVLRVEDNGRGFDLTQTSDGLGLRTLRSRVALLGGTVRVTTALGLGTQCQVRLPLPAIAL